ncbi:MAG: YceI family protein [Sphingobacteriia bacterium]
MKHLLRPLARTLTACLLLGGLLVFAGFHYLASQTYEIQTAAVRISFRGADAQSKFPKEGELRGLQGRIRFAPGILADAQFEVELRADSVDLYNGLMNKHATGQNWLNAEAYPTITYRGSQVEKHKEGYVLNGTLDLHGVKRVIPIVFDFQADSQGSPAFKGYMVVNRNDFGIGTPGGKVDDLIRVDIHVPVVPGAAR